MKIVLVDHEEKYEIDIIDLNGYDLESEVDIEVIKNDIMDVILEYIAEEY